MRRLEEGQLRIPLRSAYIYRGGEQKGYGNAIADSACALENMMIAANAFDLDSCWINQLHWLDENENMRRFMLVHGLREDETVTGGLILGYPAEGLPDRTPLERKGNRITWAD